MNTSAMKRSWLTRAICALMLAAMLATTGCVGGSTTPHSDVPQTVVSDSTVSQGDTQLTEPVDDATVLRQFVAGEAAAQYKLAPKEPILFFDTEVAIESYPEGIEGIIGAQIGDFDGDGKDSLLLMVMGEQGSVDLKLFRVVDGTVKLVSELAPEYCISLPGYGDLSVGQIGRYIMADSYAIVPPGFSSYGTTTAIYEETAEGLVCIKKYLFSRSPWGLTNYEQVSDTDYYSGEEFDFDGYDEISGKVVAELGELDIKCENVRVGWGEEGDVVYGISMDYQLDRPYFTIEVNDDGKSAYDVIEDMTMLGEILANQQ